MKLREYLRQRKLAFALKEIRDSEKSILKIALDYGFLLMRRLPEHLKLHTEGHRVRTGNSPVLLFYVPKSIRLTAIF